MLTLDSDTDTDIDVINSVLAFVKLKILVVICGLIWDLS